MSFRRKDSISPARDPVLLLIGSGIKQVSRNICEQNSRSFHVSVLASNLAQVSTGSCNTWARYRGAPAGEMLDARTVKRGIPGRAPGLRASWVPSTIKPVVSDLYRLPNRACFQFLPVECCFSDSPKSLHPERCCPNLQVPSPLRRRDASPFPMPEPGKVGSVSAPHLQLCTSSPSSQEAVCADASQSFQNIWLEIGKVEPYCDSGER